MTITEVEAPIDGLRPVHPGEILREEFLAPINMPASTLAGQLHLPPAEIEAILAEKAAITAEIALRLAKFWGTSPEFWMNLQQSYSLKTALAKNGRLIDRTVIPFQPER